MKRPAMATPPKQKKTKSDTEEDAPETPKELPVNPLAETADEHKKEEQHSAEGAGGSDKDPEEEDPPRKTTPLKKPAAKVKAKAKSSTKSKGVKKDKGNKTKKNPKNTEDPEDPPKKEKKTLKKQTDSWKAALDSDKVPEEENEEENEEELNPNEVRDRQKAQKFSKLEKEGSLPKEVTEAMEAANKSANPRAAKTLLINRLFRKEGKGFAMIPKDPAFQKVQRHLDVKYGKEQATSTLAYTIHTFCA